MAENDKLRGALEIYLQQKRQKLDEVRELDQIIARLSRDIGDVPTDQIAETPSDSMATFLGDNIEMVLAPAGRANVRPDEFFGMTYTMAAKAYLEKVRHAVSMDELLEALNRGGCPVGGREPKKTLYISLVRDVRSFVPIPGKSGFLGLRTFYPNLKVAKDRNDEREPKKKRKKRKKRSRKKTGAKVKAEEANSKSKPGPKPRGSVQPISVKEKSHPATDQTAQKEA